MKSGEEKKTVARGERKKKEIKRRGKIVESILLIIEKLFPKILPIIIIRFDTIVLDERERKRPIYGR